MRYLRQFIVFFILLVVCGFLLYSTYTDIESKTIAEVNNEQIVHAGQAAAGIKSFFTAYNGSLSFLARNSHTKILDSDGRDLMRDFFISHAGELSSITRVDENGIILYTYPVETSTGADISSQSHVRQVLNTHAVVISDVFTSVQGFRTVAFHMPVFENGTFKGSIAILIPFDTLAEEDLANIRVLDSGYAWSISRNGTVIYSPYPEQVGRSVFEVFNSSPSVIAMAQEAMKGSRGTTNYTVSGDPGRQLPSGKFHAIWLPVTVGDTSWSIIVSTPEQEILSTIQGFRNTLVIISAILIISLLFFTFYLARARGIVKEEERRSRAEDALRKSEQKFHTVADFTYDWEFWIAPDGTYIYVSPSCELISGYLPEEYERDPDLLISIVHPDDRALVVDHLSKQEETVSGKSDLEFRIVAKNGTERWISHVCKMVYDSNGEYLGKRGSNREITERKLAEQKRSRAEYDLRESEEFNRSLVENLPDIIVIYDRMGLVRFANRAALTILGAPASNIIGEPVLSFIADYQRSDVEKMMRLRLSGERLPPYEVDIRTGRGEIITAILQAVPITYRKEPVMLVMVVNITERKLAERKLLEAHRDLEKKVDERTRELVEANLHLQDLDRLKSMFIASMSHELRTPLNSIIGFTGIIAKGMAGEINAEQKTQLGMVQDSARHLLALINDVIDISKVEADKIAVGISTFNLADVVREVGTTFCTVAEEQGLAMNIEVPGAIFVTTDERRVKQIIANLVSNAIKFTDEGRVDVAVEQKGAVVRVRVRDTGIGIRKEDQDQLFRPFGRIVVPGRLTEGTGLGLYLSKKLARILGGDITMESELHNGSIFTFTFPINCSKQEDI